VSGFPPLSVRQPQPFDLVDEPVQVAGVGTAFEAVANARLRDGNGNEITSTTITVGGTGTWANFRFSISAGGVAPTPQGTLELFMHHQGDGSEIGTIVIPITFGPNLMAPADYHGFSQHEVVSGDTLSAIAQQWYSDATLWPRIFEANRNQITNPNLIFPGQVLRIPQ
jgi:nucleoid-associated protein YgaU